MIVPSPSPTVILLDYFGETGHIFFFFCFWKTIWVTLRWAKFVAAKQDVKVWSNFGQIFCCSILVKSYSPVHCVPRSCSVPFQWGGAGWLGLANGPKAEVPSLTSGQSIQECVPGGAVIPKWAEPPTAWVPGGQCGECPYSFELEK